MIRLNWILVIVFIMSVPPAVAQDTVDCETALHIWEVQGSGEFARCEGERITTREGIITAMGHLGFFIQTPPDQSDDDALTSDGIYVFTNIPPVSWGLEVGDVVTLERAKVVEFFALTQLEVTNPRRVTVVREGVAVPEPIDLATVSHEWDESSVHPLERYEGMYVTMQDARVVAPTNQFDEFALSITGERAFREPGIEPDNTPEFAGLGLPEFDLNPELLEVDPAEMGLAVQQVPVDSVVTVSGGLAYAYTDYQIWASELDISLADTAPRPVREREGDEFIIATQNVENFFDTVDDPARDDNTFEDYVPDDAEAYAMRLRKLSAQIRENLQAPDILALQEIENARTVADLIAQIQRDDPSLTYYGCLQEGNDGRGIDNAFLVRTERVTVYDCQRMPDTLTMLQPDTRLTLFGRPPLMLNADLLMPDGEPLPVTLINLHIKSLSGVETTSVQQRRMHQGMTVAAYVQAIMNVNPEANVVVLGDLNGFQFSDGLVDVVGIIQGIHEPDDALIAPLEDQLEPDLINQLTRVPEEERYSYIYNHTLQVLDHILVSPALDARITDAQFSRGNADAIRPLAEQDNTPLRTSDHDGFAIYVGS